MLPASFHPAVAAWFNATFPGPTEPQRAAWPEIKAGRNVLIAAPTGSGKTLSAFLAAIDDLVHQGVNGTLGDDTQVVYVSPLKALSNDIHRNLEEPLAGVRRELESRGLPDFEIRAMVRTGDTAQADRVAMRKRAPHILVTTPESLYLLLTSESGRQMLAGVRSIIVDEIHAVAGSKRGSHLALSLERLASLTARPLQRIGLSATQKPIEEVANFLTGLRRQQDFGDACVIVNSGHVRARDLKLVLPDSPLEPVMSNDIWQNVYDRLAQLVTEHRTTLVFANTRRMVERVTRHLSERLGESNVAAHHGSLSKELRHDAEQRLKRGELKALVATASLELGIDIGDVDLACQLGSPRSISTFLQRVGRANHSVKGLPKGRLFPLTRDELVECTALLSSIRLGELDRLIIPPQPLDVLAQQIVAEVASREYDEDELFTLVTGAWPYRNLKRAEFDSIVRMLSDGFSTRRGRQSSYLHRDAVNRKLRPRRGARLTAITCGGAIPDNADYQVILDPAGLFVGTLNEDFAIESSAGDVFQLGNSSYRILRVEGGRVRVEDAHGLPPTIPFWLGEAPARTNELSAAVARLRAQIEASLPDLQPDTLQQAVERLVSEEDLERAAAEQIVEYLAASKAMLGVLPTQDTLVFERFFDEAGGMQLIIHSPFGGRINRAYGLSLRKRFCRTFNFELQAAATEDAIVLSLGETHSFALEDVAKYLHSNTVQPVLTQAVLDAPLFTTRWRWNASISLAIRRSRAGKRTPAPLQRMAAEDLVATVFPDQLACAENLQGEREIPDHPLVQQTLQDCLHEAMDLDGLVALLQQLESGAIKVVARDLPHPSPLAQEVLNAKPYAFLDDAPLEERRTQAVASRRWLDPATAAEFGRLDPAAIQAVREEAWPTAETPDELHDALILLGAIAVEEGDRNSWQPLFQSLATERRAAILKVADRAFWVAAEQLPLTQALWPGSEPDRAIRIPADHAARRWSADEALVELVRGRLQAMGPVTHHDLAALLALTRGAIDAALLKLESEGFVLRGQFTGSPSLEWCERRLLARIHRYTIKTLRAEIEPVSAADFMRFLLDTHGITREIKVQGPQSLGALIEQLEGFEAPAAAWETDILPARMEEYDPHWLDSLCLSGRALWVRLTQPKAATAGPVRTTPIGLLTRRNWPLWQAAVTGTPEVARLSAQALSLQEFLEHNGASFFDELSSGAGLLQSQAEAGLAELVAAGLVNSDSYSGLRALLLPQERKRKLAARGRRIALFGLEDAGRWSLIRKPAQKLAPEQLEQIAMTLLKRYGVVAKRLLAREADWLPPWYELLKVYRRLENQGHLRGGRFIAGITGEQYALPDVIARLRALRREPLVEKLVSLSAADPLNLVGILTPGARVPALTGNRILLRDGVPVATYAGGRTTFLVPMEPDLEWSARNALLHKRILPPTLRAN